ncbi:cell division protein FtsQ/DivIB [Halanaerobium salsuginis]|jgi:cell division protein FtsQ|uniref:Cell division protein FtsQ n=1 Tax=Halanaerobium salsuginis TaxID=29563 RepID=A0A1I4GET6_9FIRM|nr:FtsQ-type POTRA domain-containing protein [Halanaerobium salsuginis]SFL28572.1 cell division protein FtsQ [Halanaerobium salsuginis]
MDKRYTVILLIIFFLLLVSLSFSFSPFFKIREFTIHSRNKIDQNSLRSYLTEFYGKNILFFNTDKLEAKLQQHNLISAVEVKKSYPSEIHIIIEERRPTAWIKNNGQQLIFSADGIILKEVSADQRPAIPQITGFPYLFSGQKINFPVEMKALLDIMSKFSTGFLAQIARINRQEDGIYKLYLTTGGGVNLGSSDQLEEKFAFLNSILKDIAKDQEKVDYINLQVIKHPVIKFK